MSEVVYYPGFYDFESLRELNDSLYSGILQKLSGRLEYLKDFRLDRGLSLHKLWRNPNLILGQACGLNVVSNFRGAFRLLGSPVYELPGCKDGNHRSLFIVRDEDPFESLKELVGSVCAVNSVDSNSGFGVLSKEIAPYAKSGRFFSKVVSTQSHGNSLKAVRHRIADLCSVDCISFELLKRFEPDEVTGLRVLAATEFFPVPPLVMHHSRTTEEAQVLTEILEETFEVSDIASELGLRGLVSGELAEYEDLVGFLRQSESLGYDLSSDGEEDMQSVSIQGSHPVNDVARTSKSNEVHGA